MPYDSDTTPLETGLSNDGIHEYGYARFQLGCTQYRSPYDQVYDTWFFKAHNSLKSAYSFYPMQYTISLSPALSNGEIHKYGYAQFRLGFAKFYIDASS